MSQHPDGHDDLAALDFYGTDESDEHGGAESDALDFSAADGGEESAVDALDAYAPAEPEDTGTELEAIDSQTEAAEEEDEEDAGLFTVTNPADTVSVSSFMGGEIHRVELSAKVKSMTESQLEDEILAVADLARQKGLAGQHTYLFDTFKALGVDDSETVNELLEKGLDLPSPEKAEEAQAEVFAARYGADGADE
jgi:hypothetical protein